MDAKTIIGLVLGAPILIPTLIITAPFIALTLALGLDIIIGPLEVIFGENFLPWHDFGNGQIG